MTTIAQTLAAVVGERYVLRDASRLLVYEADGLPGHKARPLLGVFPGSRDELVAVIRALAAVAAPFVARGAGTGLSGGALADGVVLVGLNRLTRILAVDAANRTATVEPGVINASLSRAVASLGLQYAPDPSSQAACTIGGNVAENAGGPHCLKAGVTLNHVVAATVVLATGDVVSLGGADGEVGGYDLLGAFVGSEGCFGIAIDVTVRLVPIPERIITQLADFTSVDDAARATSAIIAAGILPAALELMDNATIEAVEASVYAAGYPRDAAAVLLVETDGAAAGLDDDARAIEELCRSHGARQVRTATDAADRARLWQGRKKAFGAMGRLSPHLVVQDAVVPRTKLAEILAAIADIGAAHRVRVCNVFHAGDGNLHPNIPYDATDPDESARVEQATRAIMERCIAAGGTITGEHGVGTDKIGYMEALFTAPTLDAMCRLRGAFDPDRRSNPGKVVPVHSCREWATAPSWRAGRAGRAGRA